MKMICINCPRGCALTAEKTDAGVKVEGAACPRGEAYAIAELTAPMRTVTATVRVVGMRKPLPVKTKTAVPKEKIAEVVAQISQAVVQVPVRIGDVVLPSVADTGVDVVATANCGG